MANDYLGENKFQSLKFKYEVSGSPKIESIMSYKFKESECDNLWNLPKSPSRKRLIWAPHWTFEWNISENGIPKKGYSQFMKYYKFFFNLAQNNKSIDLVLRAHPLTYSEIVRLGLLSANELERFLNEFNLLPNARVDDAISNNDSYLDLFFSSDAMITDGVTFLVEYPCTGKPLLHTIGTENPPNLNLLGERISKALYRAVNEEDIVNFINIVVFKERDYMKETRMKILEKELFFPSIGVSNFIKEIIFKELNI